MRRRWLRSPSVYSSLFAFELQIYSSISGRSAGCGCIISPTKVTVGSMRQSVRGANGKWQQISQSDDALSGIVGKSPVRKLVLAVCEPNAQGVRSRERHSSHCCDSYSCPHSWPLCLWPIKIKFQNFKMFQIVCNWWQFNCCPDSCFHLGTSIIIRDLERADMGVL